MANYYLTKSDHDALLEMYRWWQRNKNLSRPPAIVKKIIYRTAPGGGVELLEAFPKADASTGSTIPCYLTQYDSHVADATSTTTLIVIVGGDYTADYPVGAYCWHSVDKTYNIISASVYTGGSTQITVAAATTQWDGLTVRAYANEQTVHCRIFAEVNLNNCIPLICKHNPPLLVELRDTEYWCIWWFNGLVECEVPPP